MLALKQIDNQREDSLKPSLSFRLSLCASLAFCWGAGPDQTPMIILANVRLGIEDFILEIA
jgi:hypothetical protein